MIGIVNDGTVAATADVVEVVVMATAVVLLSMAAAAGEMAVEVLPPILWPWTDNDAVALSLVLVLSSS